jgi:hypothetical protein
MIHPIVKNLGFNDLNSDIVTISDNKYRFNVIIFNSNGNYAKINYSAITEFRIVDRITSFYSSGYIIFNNQEDTLESFNSIGSNTDGTINDTFVPYSFRGDGRDFMLVNVEPFVNNDEDVPYANSKSKIQAIGLNYIFSIYDSEDILYEDKSMKQKKLYLYDYSYQFLKERNSYFSTGKYSKGKGNTDRSLYTGEALQRLLEETYKDYNLKPQFGNWDKGGEKIFYSSPAYYKAIDDLFYMLDNHVSDAANQYCPTVLSKKNDIWSFEPINNIFNQAYYKGNASFGDLGGPRLVENFILGKQTADDLAVSNQPTRRPASVFSYDLADYSLIDNFQLSHPAASDINNNYVSHMVHNYDVSNKTFSVDITNNNITSNLNVYKTSFVNSMKGDKDNSPNSNIPISQPRLLQTNIINKFNPNRNQNARLNSGRNRFLLSSILLNTTISFRCRGNVIRTPTNFISISRYNKQANNSFDNKSLGIYMVTSVEHLFGSGTYYNNIVAVKTYDYSKNNNINTSL